MKRLTALTLPLLFTAPLACERQAPGATDCQKLALRVVGVEDERWLDVPKVREAVTEEAVKCLTTPYDRTLVRCVEERGNTRACYAAFSRRYNERKRGASSESL